MIKILLLALMCLTTNVFGQLAIDKTSGVVMNTKKTPGTDTVLKVVYADTINHLQPALFINEKFFNPTLFATINPNLVKDVHIVKGAIQIDNITYNGQIQIKTKNGYMPKIISLNELKEKYTNLKSEPVIFMIDGKTVKSNYDDYIVDENYILTIWIDKVNNVKENINVGIIDVSTKSEENLKRPKKIMLRQGKTQ